MNYALGPLSLLANVRLRDISQGESPVCLCGNDRTSSLQMAARFEGGKIENGGENR